MENLLILWVICALSYICNSSPIQQTQGQFIIFPSKLYGNGFDKKFTAKDKDQLIFSTSNDDFTLTPVANSSSNTTTTKKVTCRPEQTEYKGRCFGVLQPLPCPDGEWLVEDPTTGKGQCVENECADFDNTGFYKGQCVKIRSEEPCPKGMRTYIYKSGLVDCDCKEGHIYNEGDGFCYEAYRQGPCKPGNVFATTTFANGVENRTTKTGCKRNPCKIDGLYCNGPDAKCDQGKGMSWMFPRYDGIFRFSSSSRNKEPSKNCVKFGSPCTPQGQGIFVLHPETNQPYCQENLHDASFGTPSTRIIGNVPILKCAPGSRRDILGNCRTPTVIDFS